MARAFAFYSDDLSSNPAGYLFSVLFSEKVKIYKKRTGLACFCFESLNDDVL